VDSKKVYTHSIEIAVQNGETDLFHASMEKNRECVAAIDEAIRACNYEEYRYKFSEAVKSVTGQYGFERVNFVLAATLQHREYDGRFSQAHKKCARGFAVPNEAHTNFAFNTHPVVLDGFVNSVRKAHVEMLAQEVGQYEKSHHMAERNRMTYFHSDFGVFVPYPIATEERLMARHSEIMEKKSVLEQIRAARKEQKQPATPKPERDKKQRGPEL